MMPGKLVKKHWIAMVAAMKCGAPAVGVLATVLMPQSAGAWGYEGHRVIAAIALAYLKPNVRMKVDALLAEDSDTTAAHDMLSAATWADTWRNSHRETSQWHFADIELDHPDLDAACFGHPPAAVPASAGPAQACLVDRLKAFEAELGDPKTPQAEKIVALKFVLHFVGDIHQPLHVADNHDHGGNCVLLSLGGPRSVSLHSYWDTRVISGINEDAEVLADQLRAQIKPAEKSAWERGDPTSWALESHQVAETVVYSLKSPPGCPQDATPIAPPANYEADVRGAVTTQLQKAGVRLAYVLNRALGRQRRASWGTRWKPR
jgi:hypothetical protein